MRRGLLFALLGCVSSPFDSLFIFLFRCRICIPASQPGPQRPRSPDAGHPQASDRAGLPPACPAASPAGRVDQGRRRAPPLANEAARRRAGRGRPQSSVDHHIHLPFTHDVCGANRGDPDGGGVSYLWLLLLIIPPKKRGIKLSFILTVQRTANASLSANS